VLAQDGPSRSGTAQVDTAGTAEALWASYFQGRSLEDRNRLVLFYAPLVRVVANRVARRMRSFQTIQELCSCGQFGLIDAIERFDPTGGFQFATYATIRIQGSIIDELRRDDILPKRMRARVRTYQVARESLESSLRRSPNFSEMAEYLDTTVAEIVELDDLATTSNYLIPLSMTDDGVGPVLVGTRADPSESADLSAMREAVRGALLRITERQRQVLVLHFLEGFHKSEIADILGVDRSRVTQLVHQGLRNLRTELGEHPL
jgi:RNA polymerase sigma factor FliA